jgi:hypothetical protein
MWIQELLRFGAAVCGRRHGLKEPATRTLVMELLCITVDCAMTVKQQLLVSNPDIEPFVTYPTSVASAHLLAAAVGKLASASGRWEGARHLLQRLLLQGGMLLRWLQGVRWLHPRGAGRLLVLARHLLVTEGSLEGDVGPGTEWGGSKPVVDAALANQVCLHHCC